MASPAAALRARVQAQHPGATVVSRGRRALVHQIGGRTILDVGPVMHRATGEEINSDWTPTSGVWQWQMLEADFQARAKSAFNGAPLVEFSKNGHTITLQPGQLEFTNGNNDIQAIASAQNVAASVAGDVATWTGAYGAGRDFSIELQTARLKKWLRIANSAALPAPSAQILGGALPVLRLQFTFAWSAGLTPFVNGNAWGGGGNTPTLDTTEPIEFRDAQGALVAQFARVRAQDSAADGPTEPSGLVQRVRRQGPNLLVEVRVPIAWLQAATYPVLIDPTIDELVPQGSDDGTELAGTMGITATTTAVVDDTVDYGAFGFDLTGNEIPSGATVDVCNLTQQFGNANNDEPNHPIRCQRSANPATLTTTANDISSRTATTASVTWSNTNLGAPGTFTSPDFSNVLQEVVNNHGQLTRIMVIIQGSATATRDYGTITTFEGSTTNCSALHIEYTSGAQTFTLNAETGSYSLTGVVAGAPARRAINAAAGAYALTGVAATLALKRVIAAEAGAYTLSGAAAGLLAARVLNAEVGAYALSGAAAATTARRVLSADPGSYAKVGADAASLAGRVLAAIEGAYALTGADATLTFSGGAPQTFELNAEPGSYAVSGAAAQLAAERVIALLEGAYALSGAELTLTRHLVTEAVAGAYAIAGADATLARNAVLGALAGAYAITGFETSLRLAAALNAEAGVYALTGFGAVFVWSGAPAGPDSPDALSGMSGIRPVARPLPWGWS